MLLRHLIAAGAVAGLLAGSAGTRARAPRSRESPIAVRKSDCITHGRDGSVR